MKPTLTPDYARTVFPDRAVVLGFRLQPMTIGHGLLLHRVGSPFVAGGRVGVGQLVTALYCLSRPWRAAANGLHSRLTRWKFKVWAWQIRHGCDQFERRSAELSISAYVTQAFNDEPASWEVQSSGKNCNAPFLQLTKIRLMSMLGQTREQAMDYPIAEANWDLAGLAESAGRIEIVSAADAEMISTISEMMRN